jgi:hypothetical protein
MQSAPAYLPKIGRPAAPIGYICWDFLFYVVGWDYRVGRYGKTLSTTLRNLTHPTWLKVDTGYPLSSSLDNGKRVVWRHLRCR